MVRLKLACSTTDAGDREAWQHITTTGANQTIATVMILSFRTPKTFVVISLKFELCGFTID